MKAQRAAWSTTINLRVLDRNGKPFPGLYAAGDCCRGLLKESDEGGKFGEMAEPGQRLLSDSRRDGRVHQILIVGRCHAVWRKVYGCRIRI